jgi:hypothetical protein
LTKESSKLEKYGLIIGMIVGVIGLIIGSVLSGVALMQSNSLAQQSMELTQQANNLTQTSLALQNITSNFEPYLLPYYVTASVPDLYTSMPLDYFSQADVYGSLNLSIVAITPHASLVNFTSKRVAPDLDLWIPNFNVTVNKNAPWRNTTNLFETTITVIPYLPFEERGKNQFFDYKPQAFVEQGVTLVNFVIPIHASISLNQTLQASYYGVNLGTVAYEFDLYDVQLRQTVAVYSGSTSILTNINPNYG